MAQSTEAKRKLTTVTEDGEIFLDKEPFEVILEKFRDKFSFSSDFEEGYSSSDPFEQSYGATMEVSADDTVITIEELKEMFEWSEQALDLIENAIDNYDCYDCWEEFVESLEEIVEDDIPGYRITYSSARLHMSKDRTAIVLSYEVDEYEFDEEENREAYAPDPYDEYRDRMLDGDW